MNQVNRTVLNKLVIRLTICLMLLAFPLANAAASYLTTDDNAKVYYNVRGEGEAIVFIHGLLVNSLFWQKNVEKLAKDYKVITIDMRGHGFTVDDHVADYTIERVAKDVKLLLDTLKIEQATLVGWSTGGFVSYKYVELFGDYKLKGICVVDMPPKKIKEKNWKYGSFTPEELEQLFGGIESADFEVRKGFVPQCFAKNATVAEPTLDFTERNFMLAPKAAFSTYMKEITTYDFRELVKKLPVPLLYCQGARSQIFPTEAGEWLTKNLPDYPENKVVTFLRSGHSPHMEESNKFNRVLNRFIHSIKEKKDSITD